MKILVSANGFESAVMLALEQQICEYCKGVCKTEVRVI